MHSIVPGPISGVPLVHSDGLQKGLIRPPARFVDTAKSLVKGPAVLLPRVGLPRADKIAVLSEEAGPTALSDCVIALGCESLADGDRVRDVLVEEWDAVRAAYVGSCAPYITIARLRTLLGKLGFPVEVQEKRSQPGPYRPVDP